MGSSDDTEATCNPELKLPVCMLIVLSSETQELFYSILSYVYQEDEFFMHLLHTGKDT